MNTLGHRIIRVAGTVGACIVGVAVVALAYIHLVPYGLSWNTTPSIPRGLYLSEAIEAATPLTYDDIVCFQYDEPTWARGRHYGVKGVRFCKPVAGLPGDRLEPVGSGLTVTSRLSRPAITVPLLTVDRAGRPMAPAVTAATEVQPGAVFLLAQVKPNSLDSRYLGAIARSRITHRVRPLWTFSEDSGT